ncbi:MAG: tRNA (N(6)-L-threonylcarbamoyladenosine(37)-C(2))-methylthiotransferase MtaB [Clostridia bacterium]|nr:tRNA (N(6)-L-threonylcarbamoyladenosine(37)-C(2))-methylthiotransferase MtaB [Clostridia bacterium]
MNIHLLTLGCKVNQYETEALREAFIQKGFSADNGKEPQIIIINSCSVTAESDRKTRQLVRKQRKLYPNAVIVLTGCMAQAFPEKAKELTEADIIAGNRKIGDILALTDGYLQNKERILSVPKHETGDIYNTLSISNFSERTRAYMKIEDGCDRFCSYCIIPYARGRVRSRDIEEIKAEALRLSKNGFCEIVLVGINLSAFGKDTGLNLCDAVDAVCSVDGIKRVRLGSLEPDHITDSMLERLKAQDKFCPQFHLSLQSGCNATLKRMNRHYDNDFYLDLINRIRAIFDDAAITTDIMVGFAGETEEEFNESLAFAEKCQFARAHIFAYSRRSGTVAAALPDQVENAEKQRRARLMAEATRKNEAAFLKNLCGKTLSVLFETCVGGFFEGYTENYSRVCVKTDKNITGEILKVKITHSDDEKCFGEIV